MILPERFVFGICFSQFKGNFRTRPDRAISDPLAKIIDLVFRQLRIRRHLQLRVRFQNGTNQNALVGIADHNRGATTTTGQQTIAVIDSQTTRRFVIRRVAVEAVSDQQWTDLLFEELQRFW